MDYHAIWNQCKLACQPSYLGRINNCSHNVRLHGSCGCWCWRRNWHDASFIGGHEHSRLSTDITDHGTYTQQPATTNISVFMACFLVGQLRVSFSSNCSRTEPLEPFTILSPNQSMEFNSKSETANHWTCQLVTQKCKLQDLFLKLLDSDTSEI